MQRSAVSVGDQVPKKSTCTARIDITSPLNAAWTGARVEQGGRRWCMARVRVDARQCVDSLAVAGPCQSRARKPPALPDAAAATLVPSTRMMLDPFGRAGEMAIK